LLPHKLSQYGPSISTGDIDNNGSDDIVLGASAHNQGSLLLQQKNGTFIRNELPAATGPDARRPEMMGLLLFDADGDSDLDLYACSGSTEFAANTPNYQDQLYINTGNGNFVVDQLAIPKNFSSKSCVKATDFDNDGDLDLFVGGRVYPGRYPEPVSSYIYRNESKNGKVYFTDVTNSVAPSLQNLGLVCDAVWTDFDNDGRQDLVITGEWMPLTFLRNNGDEFINITASTGLQELAGCWTSITSGDFDNDGDMDYIAGNIGLNSFFKASAKEPVRIYAGDLNGDQVYDAIPSLYIPGKNGTRREYPANVRDDMIEQMIGTRRKFPQHKDYADADIYRLLSKEERQKAFVATGNYLSSCYIQNNGNNRFEPKPLPVQAQLAPVNGIVPEDVNGDGWLDVIMNGNEFGNEVVNGQYDAMNGVVLLGNGKGNFETVGLHQSGYYVPGDAKALAKLVVANEYNLAATQNRDKLQVFTLRQKHKIIRFKNEDVYAIIGLSNGRKRKLEISYGNSFLSQSSRFMLANDTIQFIEVTNRKGEKRIIRPGAL
jgi:hypothetical protein